MSRDDPYLGFRYVVEADSSIVAGFSEVTGLEMEMETEDYQEGGLNTHVHKLPVRFSHPNLVLRKGLTDYQGLWDWITKVQHGQVERKNIIVILLNSIGEPEPEWKWGFNNAYPVKWTGPELQADQGAVAIESLELAHDGISKP